MIDAPAPAPKIRVVVADDNPATLYSTSRVLESGGYEVIRCALGGEALAAIDASVEVAVLDVNMPDIDGIDVCRRLRAQPQTQQMAIIHLSATRMEDSDRVEGLEAGADAYLTQPVHPQVLLATVRTLLRARAAEAAMRRSERRFRGIFDEAPCGIAVLDRELRFVEANAQMERLLRRERAELRGRHIGEFAAPGARIDTGTIIACQLADQNWSGVTRLELPPGDIVELEWNISPRLGGDELLCIVTDVTERKQLELQREQLFEIEREARAEAERLTRVKDEFLATLSHELRNPLAPMKNALYVLQMTPAGSPGAVKARDVLTRQVENMARLVDDLLDVSRITRGLVRLDRRRVSLRSVIESAIETSLPQIEARGHSLDVELPEPAVELLADPTRLAQAFTNILNNAAKYTPAGGRIGIRAALRPDAIEVAIEDNGVGIPEHMRERVFDIFTQINPHGAASAGGLGIGLTLVKRLVEMHGGRVNVGGTGSGRGTRFTVVLPQADLDQAGAGAQAAAAKARPGKAIVIDDNPDAAEALGVLLAALGYSSRQFFDPVTGMRAVETAQPDVVFVDIGMPQIDGHEVASRLKASARTRHIPLIALTGYGEEEDRQRSLAAGFDRHLTKPVSVEELQLALEQARVLATRP